MTKHQWLYAAAVAAAELIWAAPQALHAQQQNQHRPNVIIIMTDDVGYSDIGSYGGEINTPNLDKLASEGVRFTQFYNMARCCPSRASLLTGLYPHQAGVGHMLHGNTHSGYSDKLSTDSITIPELVKQAGYRTYMTGKWHVARAIAPDGLKDGWPMQRGFEKYYGIITGASSFYDPATLCRGNDFITIENDPEYKPDFYYFTDAITDNSIKFIDEHAQESPDKPFFMYVAYTAAHWPLHAPEDEIAKYNGKYNVGYDEIRKRRLAKMKELGIIPEDLEWSPTIGDWSTVENKEWEARTMETYAAMITRMDTGVGKIVEKLKADGVLENTIVMYLQDNGGCAETIGRENRDDYATDLKPMGPNDRQTRIWPPMQTRDGRPVKTGNDVMAGGPDTYNSYGEHWANVSDTPFRFYKHWVHEGGISTPLIVHWPAGIAAELKNKFVREPSHLIDLMATVVEVADTMYPETFKGNKLAPMAGKSLVPLIQNQEFRRGEPIFWEHESNRAVRDGKWKIVTDGMGDWELYDMEKDRAEMNNLADQNPELVKKMADQWQAWAENNDVLPLGTWEKIMNRQHAQADHTMVKSLFRVKAGDKLDGDERPALTGRELRLVANLDEFCDNGVIISQGGSVMGYSLYVKDGKIRFAIRHTDKLHELEAPAIPESGKPIRIVANVKLDGVMKLKAGKARPAVTNIPGVFPQTPSEGLVVGNDPAGTVADYPQNFRFNGKVNDIVVRVSDVDKPFPAPGKKANTKAAKQGRKKRAGKFDRAGKAAKADKVNAAEPTGSNSAQNQ